MNLVVDVAVGLVIDTVRWDGMYGEDESHQPKRTSQVDQIDKYLHYNPPTTWK